VSQIARPNLAELLTVLINDPVGMLDHVKGGFGDLVTLAKMFPKFP